MTPSRKLLALPLVLVCVVGGAVLALGGPGGGDETPHARARAAAPEPMEIALRPAHRSGVSGTARLVPGQDEIEVTLAVSRHGSSRLPAHIHTGLCSDEPTAANPRIWANLDDLVDGRSKTVVNVVTLPELRAEGGSINVHDPEHGLRALVCGDIPRDSE